MSDTVIIIIAMGVCQVISLLIIAVANIEALKNLKQVTK